MTRKVTVTTGSRLHFGPLSYAPKQGRHFGGVGLMIDQPGFRLTCEIDPLMVSPPETDDERMRFAIRLKAWESVFAFGKQIHAEAPPEALPPDAIGPEWERSAARMQAAEFTVAYLKHTGSDLLPAALNMEIEQTIPRHAGLGSGTQLGMAVSSALATLEGDEQADAATLALRVSRGERSAVGVHGFGQGGLIVESGQRQPGTLGTLAARAEFPAAWRVVLVTPDSESGLSGSAERDAFAHLAPMPEATTDRLCRIALTELLPAVIEADVAACGSAIYEYGKTVGTYFAPAQGGTFADPQMSALVGKLRRQGIHGVGQSSWGPTIFILCGTQVEADSLVSDLNQPGDLGNCTIRITAPLNRGATVHIE